MRESLVFQPTILNIKTTKLKQEYYVKKNLLTV